MTIEDQGNGTEKPSLKTYKREDLGYSELGNHHDSVQIAAYW